MVSVFSTAGISRREEKGVFSFDKVRTDDGAAGGVVGVVAGADSSVLAGTCPSDRCFAGLAFPAGFSLTDVSSSRTDRFFAIGEQFAAFHESPKLDVGAAVQVRQQSVYTPASLAVGYLREEQASP